MTETGSEGARAGWALSRGLLIAFAGIALLSGAIAGAVAFGAARDSGEAVRVHASPTVAAAYTAPATETPDPTTTAETTALPQPTAAHTVTEAPTATASAISTDPAGPTIASSVSATPTMTPTVTPAATPTLGDPWSATPAPTTPAPGTDLTPAAAALASEIEDEWGINVATPGQEWGGSEAAQLRNFRALADALEMLPDAIVAKATHNGHGALAVLSNKSGRTLAGWQPYGDRAANFYTNEDWTDNSSHDSNQIVLQTGADRMTIAHELLHAYQMRDVPSGSYGMALLTPEISGFMDATGWVQAVSDEELASRLHGSWDEIKGLYRYEGRDLTYTTRTGAKVHAYTPNPIEAFAVVAALYYAPPEGTELPDWPEYWDWFDANLG